MPNDDPEMPTFNFADALNPISAHKSSQLIDEEDCGLFDEDFESFQLPEDVEPVLAEESLCNQDTTNAIGLLWAPSPFNQRSGKMRRSYDIPLISAWFKEQCPQGNPVKVRVSY